MAESTYVLVELTENKHGCLDIRRIARRPSVGELIPLKRDVLFTIELNGDKDTTHCEIWKEDLAFGEGHYV